MTWTKLTHESLTSAVSQREIDAFSRSSNFADVVTDILGDTTATVRGFVYASGQTLPSDPALLPASLVPFALDFAAFRLLKRFGVNVGEDRRNAYRDALEVFNRVSKGEMRVETPEDVPAANAIPRPAFHNPRPFRILD